MDIFLYLFEFYPGNHSLKTIQNPFYHELWESGSALTSPSFGEPHWCWVLLLSGPAGRSGGLSASLSASGHRLDKGRTQRELAELERAVHRNPLHFVFLSILNHAGVWFACWWLTQLKSSLTYKNRKSHQIVQLSQSEVALTTDWRVLEQKRMSSLHVPLLQCSLQMAIFKSQSFNSQRVQNEDPALQSLWAGHGKVQPMVTAAVPKAWKRDLRTDWEPSSVLCSGSHSIWKAVVSRNN